jgi:hypothetical protein
VLNNFPLIPRGPSAAEAGIFLRIYGTAESRALSKHQPKCCPPQGLKPGIRVILPARLDFKASLAAVPFQSITRGPWLFKTPLTGRAFSKHHAISSRHSAKSQNPQS